MTGERQIDYEALAQDALRGIVRTVLMHVARSGLPGDHHFYIAFSTGAGGAVISKRLREKYPEEMTIVLQHRFWDLIVNEERFEVKLTFDGIPERLVVPFTAIKVFFDPSVPYGLQFEGSDLASGAGHELEPEGGEALDIRPGYGATRTRKGDALVEVSRPKSRRKEAACAPQATRRQERGGGSALRQAADRAFGRIGARSRTARPRLRGPSWSPPSRSSRIRRPTTPRSFSSTSSARSERENRRGATVPAIGMALPRWWWRRPRASRNDAWFSYRRTYAN